MSAMIDNYPASTRAGLDLLERITSDYPQNQSTTTTTATNITDPQHWSTIQERLLVELKWWSDSTSLSSRESLQKEIWSHPSGSTLIPICVDVLKECWSLHDRHNFTKIVDGSQSTTENQPVKFGKDRDWIFIIVSMIRMVQLLTIHPPKNNASGNRVGGDSGYLTIKNGVLSAVSLLTCLSRSNFSQSNNRGCSMKDSDQPVIHVMKCILIILTQIVESIGNENKACISLTPLIWRVICEIVPLLKKRGCLDEDTLTLIIQKLKSHVQITERYIQTWSSKHIITSKDNSSSSSFSSSSYSSSFNPPKTSSTPISKSELSQIHIGMKSLSFFILRANVLLPIALRNRRIIDNIDASNILVPLLRLRGIGTTLAIFMEYQHKSGNGHLINSDVQKIVHTLIIPLSEKINNTLLKMLFDESSSDTHSLRESSMIQSSNTANQHPTRLSQSILDILLVVNLSSNHESTASHIHTESDMLLHSSLCVGLLQGLLSSLSRLLSSWASFTEADGNHRGDDRPNFDTNTALTMCEDVLFRILPHCYTVINMQHSFSGTQNLTTTSLISDSIRCIVDCTLICERSIDETDQMCFSTRMHRLLARWLSPQGTTSPSSFLKSHALSNEFVLQVVQTHIVKSTTLNNMAGEGRDDHRLLHLLTGLFLDPRTSSDHRRNIGTVLYRLLLCPITLYKRDPQQRHIRKAVLNALCKGLCSSHTEDSREGKHSKKRSRDDAIIGESFFVKCQRWPIDEINIISPVLELLSLHHEFWKFMKKDVYAEQQIIDCLQSFQRNITSIQPNHGRNNQNMQQSQTRTESSIALATSIFLGSIKFLPKDLNGRILLQHEHLFEAVLSGLIYRCQNIPQAHRLQGRYHGLILSLFRFIQITLTSSIIKLSSNHVRLLCDLIKAANNKAFPYAVYLSYITTISSKISQALSLGALSNKFIPTLSLAITTSFSKSLSSSNHCITAVAMTSMESFASRVSPAHRGILPKCVPQKIQGLLQCRLKRQTFDFLSMKVSASHPNSPQIRWLESKILDQVIMSTFSHKRHNSSTSHISILSGSKILSLSTDGGSKQGTLVIINPNDDEEHVLEQLKRIKASIKVEGSLSRVKSHGLGCHLAIK